MKPIKHLGLKISVVMGFLAVFCVAWLSLWLGLWLTGSHPIELTQFLVQFGQRDSQVFWQWSRILGVLSYVALWLSVMTGLSIGSQSSGFWFERGTALSWHQFFTWLGLTGGLLHAAVLLKDSYLKPTVSTLMVPFTLQHPQLADTAWLWAGLGQVAWYAMLILALGALLKQKIAKTVWRYLHGLALLAYVAVVAHGLMMGSDSQQLWIQGIYLATNLLLVLMVVLRLLQLKLPVTAH